MPRSNNFHHIEKTLRTSVDNLVLNSGVSFQIFLDNMQTVKYNHYMCLENVPVSFFPCTVKISS